MTRSVPRPRRLLALLAALLVTAGVLVACGDDDDPVSSSDTPPPTAGVDGDADGDVGPIDGAATTFPVSVTAANGEVTIEERPERVVSLSASLTEILFAVDAADQVVAVDEYSDHPPGTPITDLSGFRPNLEAIAGYEPDLVVLASDRDGIVEALEATGIAVLLLPSAASVDDALDQVGVLAAATGHDDAGAALVTDLRTDLDALAAEAEGAEPLTYYYELSDSYHSATSDSFIGSLLALIGLESIADGVDPEAGKFPQLSAEYILAADPDVILVAGYGSDGSTAAGIADRPGWDQMGAVQSGAVIELDETIAGRWGPRIVELLDSLREALEDSGLR